MVDHDSKSMTLLVIDSYW